MLASAATDLEIKVTNPLKKMTIFLIQACTQNKCMKHTYVSKLAGEVTLLLGAATYPITTD